MKCRRCRGPAVIDIRRHNAAFCRDCFLHHCREQVKRAIKDHQMIAPNDRVLVAVSGGKDSLALWDLLTDLEIEADGLYLGLGIGDYSDESGRHTREFAAARGRRLIEVDLRDDYGFDVPEAASVTRPRALRRVRSVEAAPLQRSRASRGLRRGRHRPQPRRRSRCAPRQRVAMGDRLPRPPGPGAPRGAGVRAQGEAAHPAR